ncbi:MAG: YbaB/EbfC family nucleoid-associated protein [Firmicutes bacterium]|nr:YbaB/EbfC family nucleoid-associated protein [Bacillota bacterium]
MRMGMNMQKMMRQMQKMQADLARVQAELEEKTVEGTAGGGVVTVVVNGHQVVQEIRIDPEAVDPEDVEMLQDLILAAVNDGLRKSRDLSASELEKVTGKLNIPGLPPGLM